jgi:hypothetical protein
MPDRGSSACQTFQLSPDGRSGAYSTVVTVLWSDRERRVSAPQGFGGMQIGGSPRGSPPAITRQHSSGLAGFGA